MCASMPSHESKVVRLHTVQLRREERRTVTDGADCQYFAVIASLFEIALRARHTFYRTNNLLCSPGGRACRLYAQRDQHRGGWQGDLDIPGLSGNDFSMDQINPLPARTQDEVRVEAWAEVREPLELQLGPLGRYDYPRA